MATAAFGALFNVDSSDKVASPPPTLQRPPNGVELDQLSFGTRYNGPSPPLTSGRNSPTERTEAESRPPSPSPILANTVPTLTKPPRNKYRFLSACLLSFGLGLNDSAPGALLPYLEAAYDVNYSVISLIFVTNALGFVSAAPFTDTIQAKLGRAKHLVLSQILMVAAYTMLVCPSPFAVVVVSFYLSGLGMAWALALNNTFCTGLANATTLMGIFHGAYGIGGTVGPLIATAMVSTGRHWSMFYWLPLALAITNGALAYWSCWDYERDMTQPLLPSLSVDSQQRSARAPATPSPRKPRSGSLSRSRSLLRTLKNRTTVLGALFIFAYQGAEVSISGWILSFLLATRPHPPEQAPSLGYVTSGFWAGITLGRFLLSHPAQRVGEKLSVYALVAGAAAFQLLVWFVPNIVGEAVSVAIVGLLLGPIYPCAITVVSRLLGKAELVSALSIVSAMGSSGGAVAPLITGVVSQRVGTFVLNPIVVGLFGSMLACWVGLGTVSKRVD